MASKGYFVVADITGYTQFLTESELDHAELVLDALFKAQMEQMYDPFVVNSFRGDGILAYVLEGGFEDGKQLIERINQVYYSFSLLRERMYQNVTCPCKACANIPNLDLKLFVHYGSFLLQKVGDRQEMLGPDVIVVHRMMKNAVKEQTGITAYTLITEAAAERMQLNGLRETMPKYEDEYEHIGKVNMFVYDLNKAYAEMRSRQRIMISIEQAHVVEELQLPYTPMSVWQALVGAEFRKESVQFDTYFPKEELLKDMNLQEHASNPHRWDEMKDVVIDWQPGHYFTTEGHGYGKSKYNLTFVMEPNIRGCMLTLCLHITDGYSDEIRDYYAEGVKKTLEVIAKKLEGVATVFKLKQKEKA